jgi:hypothetical protein
MAISSLLHAQGAGDDDGLEREALYPGGRTFLLSPVMGFLSYAMTAALLRRTVLRQDGGDYSHLVQTIVLILPCVSFPSAADK